MAPPGGDHTAAFLQRARHEAERYGPDPWVFVRELLQNARDAEARRISFTVDEGGGDRPWVRLACHDDGTGMSLEHARRFLFRLYASSKEGDRRQAGRFGVGFWSVLRFSPDRIVIRSRPSKGSAWGLVLDLEHNRAAQTDPPDNPGTTIELERGWDKEVPDGQLGRRVLDAVRQNGRFLRTPEGLPITITVGGEIANADFSLPPPSSLFSRARMRGIVALGSAAQVELFSRGLRVRSASTLDDLLTHRHAGAHSRVAFPALPQGLAPQAVLDSDELQLLLARADARDDKALRRLVKVARRELVRLLNRQLARYRRLSPLAWVRHKLGAGIRFLARPFPAAVVVCTIALTAAALTVRRGVARRAAGTPAVAAAPGLASAEQPSAGGTTTTATGVAPPDRSLAAPYQDLAAHYRGPEVNELTSAMTSSPVALRYAPPEVWPHLAALTFEALAIDGSPVVDEHAAASGGARVLCGKGCVTIDLSFRASAGFVRLPLPTGHALVGREVILDGVPRTIEHQVGALPALALKRAATGRLRYQTAPAPATDRAPVPAPVVALPRVLGREVRRSLRLPRGDRVDHLIGVVQRHVRYDRAASVGQAHVGARARGTGFLERTLAIGAGDCDIQNAVLLALLQHAGVPSRLAAGYLGVKGGLWPLLHAWVEYEGEDRLWHVADASPPFGVSGLPARPAPVVVRASSASLGHREADRGERIAGAPDEGVSAPEAGVEVGTAAEGPTSPPDLPAPLASQPLPRPPPQEPALEAIFGTREARRLWFGAAVVGALSALVLWRRTRGRGAVRLDDGGDVARLLQGALQQPKSFRDVPAVFERPLVPLIGGGLLSLRQASRLNRRARLFCALGDGRLHARARAKGAAIVDASTPEGRVVSTALSAIDLDLWDALLARARTDELCARVNQLLQQGAESWRVAVSDDVNGDLAVLDLTALGGFSLPDAPPTDRIVMLDSASPMLLAARAAPEGGSSPLPGDAAQAALAEAAFVLIDQLVVHLRLPDERRARVLTLGARAALGKFHPVS